MLVIGMNPPLCGEFGMKVACATFNPEPVTESIIDAFLEVFDLILHFGGS